MQQHIYYIKYALRFADMQIPAYWSFWVVKSLGMPINTYLCSIYYIYDTKNAFSAGQIPP